ncbi:antitoxin [Cellulomonas hominis]|uniref:Antitoxin n=1 Tax=Cellulomonas hominis TaxID=156981 RepID=A0A511FDG5_9CELL|nr:type II toxin-antitoxin system prevent-host-death family antitoxin [Cellulomonas hominis]MBB5472202.1 PHD/YefM family antitoxin component YafN of YafNO toxin-antitoxin module [Cellulomonas hominis]NKY07660.1 type II toxin-antitoxin system Phd/YefM family antitoxin [Cellulomonas hominis]NKY11420.1 type II toxin-antitoxin system Phd/YefM family antitoxin [Cellulomonas hominis]GEL47299.1 antitoxin [Cellulomonas hominis]
MTETVMTAREFNHDVSAAKRAATHGPVVITDRGRPSHVLLTVDTWRALTDNRPGLATALRMTTSTADIEFDPPRAPLGEREVDL